MQARFQILFGNALSLEIAFLFFLALPSTSLVSCVLDHSACFAYPVRMRSRYTIAESEGVYFLTATIVNWLPVYPFRDTCLQVLESLQYCRRHKGLRLYAYVLMENHLHLVAKAAELSRCMQSYKRHTVRRILQWAETTRKEGCFINLITVRRRTKPAASIRSGRKVRIRT